jgi:hypothetical protein
MASSFASYNGEIIRPEDMAMMKQTLDDWCLEKGIDPTGPRATHVASVLITQFQSGKKSPDQLIAALRQ